MEEGTVIPEINELRVKKPLQVKIRSCFPEGTSLPDQLLKVEEEIEEVRQVNTHEQLTKEALDLAVAAVGLAEIAINNEIDRVEGVDRVTNPEKQLQRLINEKYRQKQKEWEAEE